MFFFFKAISTAAHRPRGGWNWEIMSSASVQKKQKKTYQRQTLAEEKQKSARIRFDAILFFLFTLIKQRQHHKKDVFRLPDPRCYKIIRHGLITASGASASREEVEEKRKFSITASGQLNHKNRLRAATAAAPARSCVPAESERNEKKKKKTILSL